MLGTTRIPQLPRFSKGAISDRAKPISANPIQAQIVFVVLARNCLTTIENTLLTIGAAIQARESKYAFWIYVVDDGSTDGTSKRAQEISSSDAWLRRRTLVATLSLSHGMAHSLTLAGLATRADFLITVSGNDIMTIKSLIDLVDSCQQQTITMSYRQDLFQTRPALKYFASRVLNGLLVPLLGFPYREVTGSYVLPNRDFLRVTPKDCGHGYPAFILAAYQKARLPIKIIWLRQKPDRRGENTSAIPNPKYGFYILKSLIRARLKARQNARLVLLSSS